MSCPYAEKVKKISAITTKENFIDSFGKVLDVRDSNKNPVKSKQYIDEVDKFIDKWGRMIGKYGNARKEPVSRMSSTNESLISFNDWKNSK